MGKNYMVECVTIAQINRTICHIHGIDTRSNIGIKMVINKYV